MKSGTALVHVIGKNLAVILTAALPVLEILSVEILVKLMIYIDLFNPLG